MSSMDVSSKFDSQDWDLFHDDSSTSQKHFSLDDASADLEYSSVNFFHNQEAQGSRASNEADISDEEEECEELPGPRVLRKSVAFPCPHKNSISASTSDEDEDIETAMQRMFSEDSMGKPCSHSISLPSPLKLVSAMKGTREKHGLSPKEKKSVTWAPDVYDPPPSILMPARGKKQQKSKAKDNYNNKKNGKKGQKGNSNRGGGGGGGKDKKQFRRIVGSSNKCYRTLDARDRLVDHDDVDDFDDGPESYCGSSFLKKSLTKFHYSVAEAL